MTSLDLETQRLRLVTITTEMMDADEARSGHLGALLCAQVPAQWPPENWEPHVFAFLREQVLQNPQLSGWTRYIVLQGAAPTLIGNVGAFPRGETEAEIGYAILPRWHRLGLATEAVTAFVEQLRREPWLQTIAAQTLPDLVASIGVLRKCGFELVGPGYEDGHVLHRLRTSHPARSGNPLP